MAMGIGDEYSSEKVTAKNFEQLAEEAGLGKPLVRSRVAELSEKVIAALPKVEIAHPVSEKLVLLIRQRSEKAMSLFRT
jgi:serine/threonine-protein kinase HipA